MNEGLLSNLEAWLNAAGAWPWQHILVAAVGIGFGVGLFLLLRPALAIRFQQKFYEKINWRMTPISLDKEIRNTRLMGAFLIFTLLVILFFVRRAGKVLF